MPYVLAGSLINEGRENCLELQTLIGMWEAGRPPGRQEMQQTDNLIFIQGGISAQCLLNKLIALSENGRSGDKVEV